MKKNKMCRLASVLLIMVLLTTSIVGSTFAKYTTEGTSTDTARVAKFGVTVETSSDSFAEAYKDQKVETTDDTATVITSVDGEKLVAPGTNGTLLRSVVTGKPEVEVEVSATAALTLTGWSIPTADGTGNEDYCPVVITVGTTEYKMGSTTETASNTYKTTAEFEAAVEAALKKDKVQIPANTDLGTAFSNDVSWKWNIEDTGYQTNDKDTALGNKAATAGNEPKIQLDYSVTVTQID